MDGAGCRRAAGGYRARGEPRLLIVDVYNVLHTGGVLPPRLAGMGVPELLDALARGRYRSRRTVLVCDGGGVSGARAEVSRAGSAVEILFSGHECEADDLIEGLVARHARTTRLTIVSTDRRVRRAARKAGAESLRSEDFLRQLIEDEARPERPGLPTFATDLPLDAGSVVSWLREFGLGSPDVRDLAGELRARRAAERRDEAARALRAQQGMASPVSGPRDRREASAPKPAASKADPNSSDGRGVGGESGPRSPAEPTAAEDPLLRQALREWRDRLDPADLDMSRWVNGVTPIKRRERE